MFDFEVTFLPRVWETNMTSLILVSTLVIVIIIITVFLVRKELKNGKKKY